LKKKTPAELSCRSDFQTIFSLEIQRNNQIMGLEGKISKAFNFCTLPNFENFNPENVKI
jgi:hypothetical protein